MNARMLELVKQAGFKVTERGSIRSPTSDGSVSAEVEKLIDLINKEPKISRWEGFVDRQSGAFDDSEILEARRNSWR